MDEDEEERPDPRSSGEPGGSEASNRLAGLRAGADREPDRVPVVGIGASAGGFDALREILDGLPDDTGMAFVIVQHLSPDHKSQLAGLLSNRNLMPVLEVEDGQRVEPNHVYTIPADSWMRIEDGHLALEKRKEGESHQYTIDRFLESLARDLEEQAIGVILSGTLSDGVVGLKEIRQAGGTTIVQDPETAAYGEMPQAAIDADAVDLVRDPTGIANELVRLARHPYVRGGTRAEREPALGDDGEMAELFEILKTATSIEFEHYKETTVQRRIQRRMMTTRCKDLSEYLALLREDPEEVANLEEELLILVTRFFRSEAFYEDLDEEILPELVEEHSIDDPIRVWVPGCSTGQEAYSIAIAIEEHLQRVEADVPYRIFATDVSEGAIEDAREGLYPTSIESEVSDGRLQRFFDRVEGGYRINKAIRGHCIFSVHDLTRDPPFANIDLVSCQNVIIYLDNVLQERALGMFHYSVAPDGWLVLGDSESVNQAPNLWKHTDLDANVFRPREVSDRILHRLTTHVPAGQAHPVPNARARDRAPGPDLAEEADQLLLERFSPPAVVVNADLEIVAFRGETDPYFQNPSGRATFNLVKLARDRLGAAIGPAVEEADESGRPVGRRDVEFFVNGKRRVVHLQVVPLAGPSQPGEGYVIVFEPSRAEESASGRGRRGLQDALAERVVNWLTPEPDEKDQRIEELERELEATRDYLQTLSERYEATNEELRSANEEALSTNEELQSTNEELETAKEELQATNEELVTLNDELQERNEKIKQINDDLVNLLNSVQLPIVMLGSDLRIRRYTDAAGDLLNLIDSDVGRPITDLNLPLDVDRLKELMLDVLDDLSVQERSLETEEGHHYHLRIHPYRTSDDRIDGVVLVLLEASGREGGSGDLET